jgi:Na+/melibiose symporter-like transporter
MRLGLRLAITIFPVLLIFISYWLINKKYIINEEYYENMVNEIREKLKKSDEVEIIV